MSDALEVTEGNLFFLARMASTVDVLSYGRLVLGIGAGCDYPRMYKENHYGCENAPN